MNLKFSDKQKEVWKNSINAHHRWNISFGATRSGKTYLDYYKIPFRLRNANEDGLILFLGNTKGTLERNILDPLRQIWGDKLVGRIGSNNKVKLFGREVYALGADKVSQVSKLQGAGLSYCYGDEITTWHEDVFQMLKSRLDKPGACFDGTCNPAGPNHWFKKFLESDADIFSMSFTIDDNPFLSPSFVESLKKEYKGTVFYDRFILGKWAIAEGLVYPMFDKKKHVISATEEKGIYYISVDYGTVNPCSMGLWRVSQGKAVRVQEFYHDSKKEKIQKTDEEYYHDLESLAGGRIIQTVIVDPSAASFIETVKRHGKFRVKRAKNSVIDGIRLTASMLSGGKILIDKSCHDCIREFETYSWDEKSGEDKVLKEYDHAMDDVRYFCSTILKKELV